VADPGEAGSGGVEHPARAIVASPSAATHAVPLSALGRGERSCRGIGPPFEFGRIGLSRVYQAAAGMFEMARGAGPDRPGQSMINCRAVNARGFHTTGAPAAPPLVSTRIALAAHNEFDGSVIWPGAG